MPFSDLLMRLKNGKLDKREFLGLLNKRPEPMTVEGRELFNVQSIGDDEAELLLFGEIGTPDGFGSDTIDGHQFASEINFLGRFGIKKLLLKINSIGGSVIQGQSISTEILTSPMEITTLNSGLAASTAAFIQPLGHKRLAFDFATGMIHDPRPASDNMTPEAQKAVDRAKDGAITLMVNNSRGKLSREEADRMMTETTFFNMERAVQLGLVDEDGIIASGQKITPPTDATPVQLMMSYYVPSFKSNQKEQKNIPSMINVTLGLNPQANEESQNTAVLEIVKDRDVAQRAVTDLEAKNTELKARLEIQEAAGLAERQAKATEILNNLINQKVFPESSREHLLTMAVNDFVLFEKTIGAMNVKTAPAIDAGSTLPDTSIMAGISDDRKDWDYQKWRKAGDGSLEQLKKDHPETVQALYEKWEIKNAAIKY